MGAIFPVFDKEIEGIDISSVDGKMLNLYDPELDEIAQSAGFVPLMNFFGASPADYFEEDEFEELKITDDQLTEKWFEPEDGLKTVRFLLEYVRKNPEEFESDAEYLVSDLENFARVLQIAQKAGAKWHVTILI